MKQRLLKQQLQDDPSKHVDARNVNGVIPHGMMIPADEHPMLSPNLPFSWQKKIQLVDKKAAIFLKLVSAPHNQRSFNCEHQ